MASAMATMGVVALSMDKHVIEQSLYLGGHFIAEPLSEQRMGSEGGSRSALRTYFVQVYFT